MDTNQNPRMLFPKFSRGKEFGRKLPSAASPIQAGPSQESLRKHKSRHDFRRDSRAAAGTGRGLPLPAANFLSASNDPPSALDFWVARFPSWAKRV